MKKFQRWGKKEGGDPNNNAMGVKILPVGIWMTVEVFFFVLFCFVLFCFVLFCFVLFCFVLFCFVLFVCLGAKIKEASKK